MVGKENGRVRSCMEGGIWHCDVYEDGSLVLIEVVDFDFMRVEREFREMAVEAMMYEPLSGI